MDAEILHHGFDGLRFTVQADIPPKLRKELAAAREHAKATQADCALKFGGFTCWVKKSNGRGFTVDTGELGAIWFLQDPENRIPNNPGITVDFRALGLALGGLDAAEVHFRDVMDGLAIPYVETQLRVARCDYAIDVLSPWFEPSRDALVVPPGTRVTEYTGVDETTTMASGGRVTGLRAGAIANRQLAIYDKRAEVIQQRKHHWKPIWDKRRAEVGRPPLDLTDRDASQVWRFEMRLGTAQLRRRFDMRSWQDLRNVVGDAFTDFLERMSYRSPTRDSNRSRWPVHLLWRLVEQAIHNDLSVHRSGVLPSDVIRACEMAKKRELDEIILGSLTTRAAISGVQAEEFSDFLLSHTDALCRLSKQHRVPLEERLEKARARYHLT